MPKQTLLNLLMAGILQVFLLPWVSAQISIGPVAGVAATGFRWPSDIRTSPQSDPQTRFGLVGGISLEVEVSGTLALHTELLFHQKGGKLVSRVPDQELGETTYESNISLNYAEIPVLLRFYSKNAGTRLYAGLGLAASCGLYGRDEIAILYAKDGTGPVTDIAFLNIRFNENYKRWDASLLAEAGIAKELGPGTINAGLRMTQGLTSIIKDTASLRSAIDNLVNRSLVFSVGYRIFLY